MARVRVDLGAHAVVACTIARTAAEQARGLQGHPGLLEGEGMLFPFHPPRAATFHMGQVAFPIDVVFTDGAGVVGRIVHAAAPGSRARWSHPVVGAVVELEGNRLAKPAMPATTAQVLVRVNRGGVDLAELALADAVLLTTGSRYRVLSETMVDGVMLLTLELTNRPATETLY